MVTKIEAGAVNVAPIEPDTSFAHITRFDYFFGQMLQGLFANHQQWNDVEAKIRKAAEIARKAVELK